MLTYVLVFVLNGVPTTAPVQFATLKACEEAGAAFVKEVPKLRGIRNGEFLCVPVDAQ